MNPFTPAKHKPTQPTRPTPEKRTHRHFLIEDSLWHKARIEAAKQDIPVGDVINEALRQFLKDT